MTPKDVDLSKGLQGKFGLVEFEEHITTIVRFLADDSKKIYCLGFDCGDSWHKKFRIDTFHEINPGWFAMLCASGWIQNTWFPKGTFCLSKAAVDRLLGIDDAEAGVTK